MESKTSNVNEMKDLISIIIPVYNVEKYLANCIGSVIKQTYTNIEVLLINDGSTDNSQKICENYMERDKRVILINKENGGASDARNIGIKNSNGKYIAFVDSDDTIEENYVEYLYNLLLKYKTNMSIAAYSILSNEKIINIGQGYKETLLDVQECLDRLLCEKGFTVSPCAKLYDKKLFDNIKYPTGKLFEDNETTYKLIIECPKIAYGNESIYNYYKRENSMMTSKFNMKKLDLIELSDKMCDDIENKYPKLKNSTDKKRITARFSMLRQILVGKLDDKQKKVVKEIKKYIMKRKWQIFKNEKIDKRDKIALISLMFGNSFFAFAWKVYSKIKYR